MLLRLAAADERTLINRIKALAPAVQRRDVALILDGHADLAARAAAMVTGNSLTRMPSAAFSAISYTVRSSWLASAMLRPRTRCSSAARRRRRRTR